MRVFPGARCSGTYFIRKIQSLALEQRTLSDARIVEPASEWIQTVHLSDGISEKSLKIDFE